MSTNEFWTNDDGLNIRFGLEKGVASREGATRVDGDLNELRVRIGGSTAEWAADANLVSSTDKPVATQPLAGIPNGAYIESATLYVTTAFVGTSGTLDIGLWYDDGDGTFSVYDLDGIDAAIAVTAIDAADDRIACDGDLVNATMVGTGGRPVFVSNKGHATNDFTAGQADLVIRYRVT